jgi:hypothetical protein
VLAILERRFQDEEHLRNALRLGIRHRALHLRRDQRRRGEILSENARAILRIVEGTQRLAWPEEAALGPLMGRSSVIGVRTKRSPSGASSP